MSENLAKGRWGEAEARAHLEAKGHRILAQNWRYGKDEVDLISKDGPFLVFTEVKTRHSDKYGRPESFVTREKQRYLIRAANAFVQARQLAGEVRFDLIGITEKPEFRLVHCEAAFYP